MAAYQVSVFLALIGLYLLMSHGPDKWNESPAENFHTLTFKILPMFSLLLMVYYTTPKDNDHEQYKTYIFRGLLFSLAGDVALVWKTDLFMPGLLFFAIAHVWYIVSFRFRSVGIGTALLSFLSATVIYMFIVPQIKELVMKFLVAMYIYLIFTMFWRAHVRWNDEPRWDSLLASVGAIFFIISDFILAYNKWVADVYLGAVFNMSTYYLGQLGLALSVALYFPYQTDEIREKKRG